MSHSYNKIWIHAIWSTKNRAALIQHHQEQTVYSFIKKQFEELGCKVSLINGMPDHIHCLFLLNSQKSIAEVVKQIKGSSSHYLNQQEDNTDKFAWQIGYAAFSVSESVFKKAFYYIRNQKEHHTKLTFEKEYAQFLKLNGLE